MTLVGEILEKKDPGRSKLVSVSPDDTVLDAARIMNEARIGAVVVCEPDQGIVGIFSERDILRRVVAECRSPDALKIGEVMSRPVTCCKPSTTLAECQTVMITKRIRHLPVVENKQVVGMISIGDLLATEVELQQSTIEYLNDYLYGRV